jgi:hypothetical protein
MGINGRQWDTLVLLGLRKSLLNQDLTPPPCRKSWQVGVEEQRWESRRPKLGGIVFFVCSYFGEVGLTWGGGPMDEVDACAPRQ